MRKSKAPQPPATEGWFLALRQELAEPTTRVAAAVEIGDWARNLCLALGSGIDTAYAVGGILASGVAASWRGNDALDEKR